MLKNITLLIILIVCSLFLIGCGDEEKTSVNLVKYQIIEVEDVSTAKIKHFTYHVVVSEPATIEQLKEVCQDVVKQAEEKEKFNAVTIYLSDYPEYRAALGKTIFTLDGDMAKAAQVSAGDYKKMSFKYELLDKEWDKRLTSDEVKVWAAWHKEIKGSPKEYKNGEEMEQHEDAVSQKIAEKFNTTAEVVDNILLKQAIWLSSNKK